VPFERVNDSSGAGPVAVKNPDGTVSAMPGEVSQAEARAIAQAAGIHNSGPSMAAAGSTGAGQGTTYGIGAVLGGAAAFVALGYYIGKFEKGKGGVKKSTPKKAATEGVTEGLGKVPTIEI